MGVVVLQITTEQTISWLCKKKSGQLRQLEMSNLDILSWEQADWIQWNSCQKRPLKYYESYKNHTTNILYPFGFAIIAIDGSELFCWKKWVFSSSRLFLVGVWTWDGLLRRILVRNFRKGVLGRKFSERSFWEEIDGKEFLQGSFRERVFAK